MSQSYTIAELARLTGLNVRTIRYYIAQGLIPASGESGPGAHYGQGHLDRLALTRRLQAQHLPLAEIRARLAQLSDADVAGLVAAAESEPSLPVTSALEYVRGLLAGGRGGAGLAEPAAPRGPGAHVMPTGTYPSVAPRAQRKGVPDVPLMRLAMPPAARQLAATEGPPAALRPPDPKPSIEQPTLERSQWERFSLGPNLELHVRRPLSRLEQRRVERLITIARQVLREDRS